ncbi:hypothetical protein C0991_002361 [Blastosporella zonata]|nr:hypothetical protein C0991_002361 [Blastosporella zonata]
MERLNIVKRVTREWWNVEENSVIERVHSRLAELKAKKNADKDAPPRMPSSEEISDFHVSETPGGKDFLEQCHGFESWVMNPYLDFVYTAFSDSTCASIQHPQSAPTKPTSPNPNKPAQSSKKLTHKHKKQKEEERPTAILRQPLEGSRRCRRISVFATNGHTVDNHQLPPQTASTYDFGLGFNFDIGLLPDITPNMTTLPSNLSGPQTWMNVAPFLFDIAGSQINTLTSTSIQLAVGNLAGFSIVPPTHASPSNTIPVSPPALIATVPPAIDVPPLAVLPAIPTTHALPSDTIPVAPPAPIPTVLTAGTTPLIGTSAPTATIPIVQSGHSSHHQYRSSCTV